MSRFSEVFGIHMEKSDVYSHLRKLVSHVIPGDDIELCSFAATHAVYYCLHPSKQIMCSGQSNQLKNLFALAGTN